MFASADRAALAVCSLMTIKAKGVPLVIIGVAAAEFSF
jgi:hypothetical protein